MRQTLSGTSRRLKHQPSPDSTLHDKNSYTYTSRANLQSMLSGYKRPPPVLPLNALWLTMPHVYHTKGQLVDMLGEICPRYGYERYIAPRSHKINSRCLAPNVFRQRFDLMPPDLSSHQPLLTFAWSHRSSTRGGKVTQDDCLDAQVTFT